MSARSTRRQSVDPTFRGLEREPTNQPARTPARLRVKRSGVRRYVRFLLPYGRHPAAERGSEPYSPRSVLQASPSITVYRGWLWVRRRIGLWNECWNDVWCTYLGCVHGLTTAIHRARCNYYVFPFASAIQMVLPMGDYWRQRITQKVVKQGELNQLSFLLGTNSIFVKNPSNY